MKLRSDLPPLPPRIARLPVDAERGYPIPWFVATIDGKRDFRVIEAGRKLQAVRDHRCWVCGEPLGVFLAFNVGPMCAVNHMSGEPPSHLECALWSAQACPFLTKPQMVRRTSGLPENITVDENMLMRNPAVTMVWVTKVCYVLKSAGNLLF